MKSRPLQLPSAAALERLGQRAQAAVDTWAQEWRIGRQSPAVLTISTSIDREEWQSRSYQQLRDASGGLWIRADVPDRARLRQTIIGPDLASAPGELIEEIVDLSAAARAEELRAALFGEAAMLPDARIVDELPAELFAFGSGAVQLACSTLGLHAIVYATHSSFWTTMR